MCRPIASATLVFPVATRYLPLYALYQKMTNVSWRHTNVISAGDKAAYTAVDERVKRLYIPFLKLLNSVDTIVGENWKHAVPKHIREIPLVDFIRRFVEYIEAEHALTYQKFISDFIEDPLVRKELFESNQIYGPIIHLDEYAKKYVQDKKYPYTLFANMLIEHILLPVIFTFVGWTADTTTDIIKRVPGFINANTYIQADEKTHVEFAFMLLDMYPAIIPPQAEGCQIIDSFVSFVDKFLESAFEDIEVPGITAQILMNVARAQANDVINRFYGQGKPSYYTVGSLPGYMLSANRMKKEAFFETNSAVYSHVVSSDWGSVSASVMDI